ncbi:sigma-70 family RNA polymerase sigma factor [Enterococcus hulanensis]|uniref:sigma-70 family RNA polymerase sigma factor n=1 Tax=Enterococcus hulanensis TaxID=2559929 RepID=UPI0010F67254|nr:sigma-70 family RNA polymerase sigma factor [Enterococcus hulanensis]MBO0458828.1 sigma-70 family RNA polymerase sigma factor [Enterococcus hulanensis]
MIKVSDEKLEAQLTKYFHKVICNTASNYYKKNFYQKENEYLTDQSHDFSKDSFSFEEESLRKIMVEESVMNLFYNEKIEYVVQELSSREKQFLIEKFVFDKTDEQIGAIFGTSRQAVTNMKSRLYKKMRKQLKEEGFES